MPLQRFRQAVSFGVRDGVAVLLVEVCIAEALKGRIGIIFRVFRPRDQHDPTIQLALESGKVFLGPHGRNDDRCFDRAMGGGRPGDGYRPKREWTRTQHPNTRRLNPPTSAELKTFGVDVFKAPAAKLALCPRFRLTHRRRVRQSTPDRVTQVGDRGDDLTVVESRIGNSFHRHGIHRRCGEG